MGRAMVERELALVSAAGGADHGAAEMLDPLRRNQADAAGCCVPQQGGARADAVGALDQVAHGHALQHHGRRRLVVDTGRAS